MTRPSGRHLNDMELDVLVFSSDVGDLHEGLRSSSILRECQLHLEDCEECSRKIQMHRKIQDSLFGLHSRRRVAAAPSCPSDVDWAAVAAGLVESEKARELTAHAAHCEHCGPLLVRAAELLSDDATEEENELLQDLQCARPACRNVMDVTRCSHDPCAEEVSHRPAKVHESFWFSTGFRWSFAAFMIIIALATGWYWKHFLQPSVSSVNELLAQAYSQHRSIDLRFGQVRNAPLRPEETERVTLLARPPVLLEAETQISKGLASHPNDPLWLQAKARADLLEANPWEAAEYLQRALQLRPGDESVAVDLASAYSETGHRSQAVDLLSHVLERNPGNAVALFNRAKILQRQYTDQVEQGRWENAKNDSQAAQADWREAEATRHNALADLKRFIVLDPSGPWADEAMDDIKRWNRSDALDAGSGYYVPPGYYFEVPDYVQHLHP